jgi:hypothetical protein
LVAFAGQDYINSFSLPFQDAELWKGLVEAQVRRAQALGVTPVQVMRLIATGGPIAGLRDEEFRGDLAMGGEIFLRLDRYDVPADVFAFEDAQGLDAEHAGQSANLSEAVFHPFYKERGGFCKCFVCMGEDSGEISGTRRTVIDGWSLYEATDPNYIESMRTKTPSPFISSGSIFEPDSLVPATAYDPSKLTW